jgi:hypothetical protein
MSRRLKAVRSSPPVSGKSRGGEKEVSSSAPPCLTGSGLGSSASPGPRPPCRVQTLLRCIAMLAINHTDWNRLSPSPIAVNSPWIESSRASTGSRSAVSQWATSF